MTGSRRGHRAPRVPRSTAREVHVEDAVVEVMIQAGHSESIKETEDHFKAMKTVKEHNRRIKEQILWTQREYPDFYAQTVIELTDEQKMD